jgi:cytoskeletal protein RodZ
MSDFVPDEPIMSEPTGTFHYQELIESRLGQPIAADILAQDAARVSASPGARLAAGRTALGWSIEQVASQLRLTPRQILSIEADDFAALPESAIVRGFIRAYAKLVKLEPAPLIALISVEPGAKARKLAVPDTSPEARSSRGNASKTRFFFSLRFFALFICVVLALVLWFILFAS